MPRRTFDLLVAARILDREPLLSPEEALRILDRARERLSSRAWGACVATMDHAGLASVALDVACGPWNSGFRAA
jgi:hypothetical protein